MIERTCVCDREKPKSDKWSAPSASLKSHILDSELKRKFIFVEQCNYCPMNLWNKKNSLTNKCHNQNHKSITHDNTTDWENLRIQLNTWPCRLWEVLWVNRTRDSFELMTWTRINKPQVSCRISMQITQQRSDDINTHIKLTSRRGVRQRGTIIITKIIYRMSWKYSYFHEVQFGS